MLEGETGTDQERIEDKWRRIEAHAQTLQTCVAESRRAGDHERAQELEGALQDLERLREMMEPLGSGENHAVMDALSEWLERIEGKAGA